MKTFWLLYRENPFRVLYREPVGFARPRRDERRPLWLFPSEEGATNIRRYLRADTDGITFIGKRSKLAERIKEEVEQ